MKFNKILNISRPRFWIYELGSYIVGFASVAGVGNSLWMSALFLVYFLYFTFPANIYIYGINDIFDYETDKLNPKKVEYETLVTPSEHSTLYNWILLSNIPFAAIAIILIPTHALFALIAFLFFAAFYSAKPIRAKAKPFLDSFFSAAHYIATVVFGYYLAGGTSFPWLAVIAGMSWAIAMHAYSAVPDIKADSDGGLQTIATKLGAKGTLLICFILYTLAGVIAYQFFPLFAFGGFLIYTALMFASYQAVKENNENKLFTLYTYFPRINTVIGMILFFLVLFSAVR